MKIVNHEDHKTSRLQGKKSKQIHCKSVTMTVVRDHKKKNSKILIRYFQKYNI